jgi:hypothetical protein
MGIAVFAAAGLFAPLHSLVSRLAAAQRSFWRPVGVRRGHLSIRGTSKFVANQQETTWTEGRFDSGQSTGNCPRPLRVVRMVERGHRPGAAGRMVISGRMADVCAELERMEQLASHATAHP